MATADRSVVKVEMGREAKPMAMMANSGDNQIYTVAGAQRWSGYSGFEPNIRPNGVVSGRNILTPGTAANKVSVASFSAYSKGIPWTKTAAADAVTITRPATDVAKVNSIVMQDDGTLAVVAGVDGADTTFSEVRAAAGGPPEIPADAVEIGQIRITTSGDAVIDTEEIYQIEGEHVERFDSPGWTVKTLGYGLDAESSDEKYAHVKFNSALDLVHANATPKRVYAKVYTPKMVAVQKAKDFVAPEMSHSTSSEDYYDISVASAKSSLGQGSFTAALENGITDGLVREKNNVLTFQYFADKNKPENILCQGKFGIKRSFPIGSQINIAATITAENAAVDFDE